MVIVRKRLSLRYFNVKKTRMVFILAASSLHHAFETLTLKKSRYEDKSILSPA